MMPLESLRFIIVIGTHTDSMPLDGPGLGKHLEKAIVEYKKEYHQDIEIVELEHIIEPEEREIWNNIKGWVGPNLK